MGEGGKFKAFVHKHGLASVAIGFVVGHSGGEFLESIITGLFMPLFNPLLGGVKWSEHAFALGPFEFLWGPVFAKALHLAVVLLVVALVIKLLEYEERDPE